MPAGGRLADRPHGPARLGRLLVRLHSHRAPRSAPPGPGPASRPGVNCGLALAGLHALRSVPVPAWLAPPPPPGAATRRERQRDVVRSIARHLAAAEAAWKRERAGDRGDEARADAAEGSP